LNSLAKPPLVQQIGAASSVIRWLQGEDAVVVTQGILKGRRRQGRHRPSHHGWLFWRPPEDSEQ